LVNTQRSFFDLEWYELCDEQYIYNKYTGTEPTLIRVLDCNSKVYKCRYCSKEVTIPPDVVGQSAVCDDCSHITDAYWHPSP